jgi:hypothetical protein
MLPAPGTCLTASWTLRCGPQGQPLRCSFNSTTIGPSRKPALGNPDGCAALAKGRIAQVQAADEFARSLQPMIESLRATGVTKLRDIAATLNQRGIRTVRGASWHVSNVKNLIDRVGRHLL